ncbi:MAG: ABC transporter ATP-binding protein, partial [Candidatus Nanopelagicales bacterium]|nr:ABC transporter ATP-binding protein [Candidatus Nanopelagicales bacterium]MDZ4250466.1 ABC transporter ATP-binding protein [Candidatus Nanopelagicales bacterium]
LNVIGGIESATGGQVVINGQNLVGQSPEKLATIRRDNIAFVFQFYNLIPMLTAAENVRVIPELTHKSSGRELTERVTESPTAVDLLQRSDHFPGQMSGGQQQRVAIARALITRPHLMLCDEPTGALDLDTGRQVLGLLRQTAEEGQCCVVIVTHNSGIAAMADRVIRLHDGSIAEIVTQEARPANEVTWSGPVFRCCGT